MRKRDLRGDGSDRQSHLEAFVNGSTTAGHREPRHQPTTAGDDQLSFEQRAAKLRRQVKCKRQTPSELLPREGRAER